MGLFDTLKFGKKFLCVCGAEFPDDWQTKSIGRNMIVYELGDPLGKVARDHTVEAHTSCAACGAFPSAEVDIDYETTQLKGLVRIAFRPNEIEAGLKKRGGDHVTPNLP